MVKVAAAVPVPGLTEAGANAQLAPAGKLEQASETAPTLPAVTVTVTWRLAFCPGDKVRVEGEAPSAMPAEDAPLEALTVYLTAPDM